MSHRKSLLHAIAWISRASAVSSLGLGVLAYFYVISVDGLGWALLIGNVVGPLTFVCFIRLAVEYTEVSRRGMALRQRARGLSSQEIASLVRYCPLWLGIASGIDVAASILYFVMASRIR